MPLLPESRQPRAFWATRHAASPWPESDTAGLISQRKSLPLARFNQRMGPVLDQSRVAQRINDAAVVAGKIAHDFDNISQVCRLCGYGFADASDRLHSAPIHRRGEFRRQSWDSVHTAVAHAESVWSCKTDAKHALDDGCQRGSLSAPGHAKLHSVSDQRRCRPAACRGRSRNIAAHSGKHPR